MKYLIRSVKYLREKTPLSEGMPLPEPRSLCENDHFWIEDAPGLAASNILLTRKLMRDGKRAAGRFSDLFVRRPCADLGPKAVTGREGYPSRLRFFCRAVFVFGHAILGTAVVLGTAAVLAASAGCALHADDAVLRQSALTRSLLETGRAAELRLTSSSPQVTVNRSQDPGKPGFQVTIQPGEDAYPSVSLKPTGAAWDLSRFGHVEARVVNTGAKPLTVALRVDNAGSWQDNPWDTESVDIAPGQSGTVTLLFGYAYGHKPGFPLKPAAIVNLMVFTSKSGDVQSFRIETLQAGGPAGEAPPIDPALVRVKPPHGSLLDTDAKTASQNAQALLSRVAGRQSLRAVFPPAAGEQSVSLQPVIGQWDLRDYSAVRVTVRNEGLSPALPRVRLESGGGISDWIPAPVPLKPGASAQIDIPFAGLLPADLARPETESHITSDAIGGVTLALDGAASERNLRMESVQAVLRAAVLPPWLGKRPPVAGGWVKTLDDEFNGPTLDASVWSLYGDNYWDKQTHWSKSDVLLGGGMVRLRYEKKHGFNNDDPAQKPSEYAAGYLHTYGKWVQRYGYFEARMKLPTAPGLWPAFWMMPDRGTASGLEQGKRQDTGNGAMEFDIMEHLTRWGSHRYNIAMHYDGYGKDHKQVGLDKIYVQPDQDGFITCGLLWTPGSAVYYCNGLEVLRWKNPRISAVPSILMFTLPMGGWDNNAVEDARLPADFVIDYVRVWQRRDLASTLDGKERPDPAYGRALQRR